MKPTLNTGVYTVPDAARLVGKSPRWVWRVLRGYEVEHGGRHTSMRPVFGRDFSGDDENGVISFLDLIELAFIRDFREAGLSMQVIRKAASIASAEWNESHPFCVKKFETDGKTVFFTATAEDGSTKMVDLVKRQHVFERVLRPFIKQLEYAETGTLLRWFPLGRDKSVVIDPRVAFGRPYVAGSGVPVSTLFDAAKAGSTPAQIAEWFEVSKKQVVQALNFAAEKRLLAA